MIVEDNLRSLGPIPSNPVDLDISSVDKKVKTKFSSTSGKSNLTFSGIFLETNSLSYVKSDCDINKIVIETLSEDRLISHNFIVNIKTQYFIIGIPF